MFVLDVNEEKKIVDQSATYFLTFTIVNWIDIFTRQRYRDIVLDSLNYCIKQKQLTAYGWVIMSNHIHLITSSSNNDLSGTIRDFKKFTSKEIIKSIQDFPESRREWLLNTFEFEAKKNGKNKLFKLWQNRNHPVELLSSKFLMQKLDYIHNNPVEAGIVKGPHEYIYSSAGDYAGNIGLVDVDLV